MQTTYLAALSPVSRVTGPCIEDRSGGRVLLPRLPELGGACLQEGMGNREGYSGATSLLRQGEEELKGHREEEVLWGKGVKGQGSSEPKEEGGTGQNPSSARDVQDLGQDQASQT